MVVIVHSSKTLLNALFRRCLLWWYSYIPLCVRGALTCIFDLLAIIAFYTLFKAVYRDLRVTAHFILIGSYLL